jgi:hypothetical protein
LPRSASPATDVRHMALEKANHLFDLKKKKQTPLFIHLFSHWKKQTFNYLVIVSFILISGTWRLKKQTSCELQAKNLQDAFASAPQRTTKKKTESFLCVKNKKQKARHSTQIMGIKVSAAT